MSWPFPPPTRRDVVIVLVVAALAAGFIYVVSLPRYPVRNSVFGPDWDCGRIPSGDELVCVKRPPAQSPPSN